MTPAVLGLVLFASVAHALWNIAAKSVSGKGYAFVLAYHGLSAILLAPIAIWLLASGAHEFSPSLLGAAALSAIFHIAYSVSLQSGYDHAPLGVVYPTARGVGPIITIIIAVLFLGERPTPPETIGAFVVIAGIAVVTVRPKGAGGGHATSSHGIGRGLAWG
ncbi:MAG: EamA family transporter, partial [Brevibacterium aurantiacum]